MLLRHVSVIFSLQTYTWKCFILFVQKFSNLHMPANQIFSSEWDNRWPYSKQRNWIILEEQGFCEALSERWGVVSKQWSIFLGFYKILKIWLGKLYNWALYTWLLLRSYTEFFGNEIGYPKFVSGFRKDIIA